MEAKIILVVNPNDSLVQIQATSERIWLQIPLSTGLNEASDAQSAGVLICSHQPTHAEAVPIIADHSHSK
jgi:hypothetical protein